MHRTGSWTENHTLRAALIALCASALVLAVAPTAFAQKGGGLGGGGGGGGGGGASGKGGRGSRDQEKKVRPKRNEVPPVDPAAAREKLQSMLVMSLQRGTATTPYLMNLFDQASTGAVPASAQARRALAEALSADLKGKKLDESAAAAIAEPIVVIVNIDGLEPDEVTAKKDPLREALSSAGVSEAQVTAALDAADRIVAEQQDEAIKKLMDDLAEIQKEGTVGDDRKKTLAENITALSDGAAAPDEATVTKLAEDLTKGLDAAQLTQKEQAQLAHVMRAVANSHGMPPGQLMPLLNEARSVLKAGLVKGADIQTIANDLQSLHKTLGAAPPAAPAPEAGDAAPGEPAPGD